MLACSFEEAVAMQAAQGFPRLRQVVLDGTDARLLAEFYRQLLGWRYRPGDDPPPPGDPDPQAQQWLVLRNPDGHAHLAFQPVPALPKATWPEGPVPQQLHLDLTVPTTAELDLQHERALALGAELLDDRVRRPRGAAARLRRPGRAPVLHLRGAGGQLGRGML